MRKARKAYIPHEACVACGRCVKECPKKALRVYKGMYAIVNEDCIGCSKCAKVCPAGIIQMVETERSPLKNAKKMV